MGTSCSKGAEQTTIESEHRRLNDPESKINNDNKDTSIQTLQRPSITVHQITPPLVRQTTLQPIPDDLLRMADMAIPDDFVVDHDSG